MHSLTISQRAATGASIVLTAVGLLLFPLRAVAADFCAVSAKVAGADGKPITSTWIELRDQSGTLVLRRLVGREFEICDFGFGPHTLTVGTNECLPVTISNLQVVTGAPLHLNIILDACGYRETWRTACLLYFRTVDTTGKAVPNVDFEPKVTDQPTVTDSYGRWQSLFSGSSAFTFKKSGYAATVAKVNCRGTDELDVEVVLRRQP